MTANETLVEALAYAAKGYRLGPVTVRQSHDGSKSVVFHTAWSQPDGTSDNPDQITRWAAEFPGCSFHAPTGPNRIVVADLDGEQGVQAWYSAGGPRSPMTVTTRSGRHLYFRAPAEPIRNSAGAVAPHVDIRGDGGTVFISGTRVHGATTTYVAPRILAPDELPVLPVEWADRCRAAGPAPAGRRKVHRLRPVPQPRPEPRPRAVHSRAWIDARARSLLRALRREKSCSAARLYDAALAGYRAVRIGAMAELEFAVELEDVVRGQADVSVIERARRDAAAETWEVTP